MEAGPGKERAASRTQYSPDGRWRWDGQRWNPVQQAPAPPQHSADGRWWWNGRQWILVQSTPDPPVEAAPASAPAGAGAEATTATAPMEPAPRIAPHRYRLLAFVLDLLVPAAAAGVMTVVTHATEAVAGTDLIGPWVVLLLIALVGVLYHGSMIWLTGGQTIGKALCSLTVRRIDGSAPARDVASLAWAIGRAGLGYLVIDMFGLGLLVALANRRHRCLHDYVFRSEVVALAAGSAETRAEAMLQRLHDLAELRREGLREAKKKRYGALLELVWWLLKLAGICLTFLLAVASQCRRGATHAQAASSVTPAAALSTPATGAIVAGTTALTLAVVGIGAMQVSAASVVGDWDSISVVQTGFDTFEGRVSGDFTFAETRCVAGGGTIKWHLQGRGPRYTGSDLWSHGNDGSSCGFAFGQATFELIDHDHLRVCTTSPEDSSDRRCYSRLRTAGRPGGGSG